MSRLSIMSWIPRPRRFTVMKASEGGDEIIDILSRKISANLRTIAVGGMGSSKGAADKRRIKRIVKALAEGDEDSGEFILENLSEIVDKVHLSLESLVGSYGQKRKSKRKARSQDPNNTFTISLFSPQSHASLDLSAPKRDKRNKKKPRKSEESLPSLPELALIPEISRRSLESAGILGGGGEGARHLLLRPVKISAKSAILELEASVTTAESWIEGVLDEVKRKSTLERLRKLLSHAVTYGVSAKAGIHGYVWRFRRSLETLLAVEAVLLQPIPSEAIQFASKAEFLLSIPSPSRAIPTRAFVLASQASLALKIALKTFKSNHTPRGAIGVLRHILLGNKKSQGILLAVKESERDIHIEAWEECWLRLGLLLHSLPSRHEEKIQENFSKMRFSSGSLRDDCMSSARDIRVDKRVLSNMDLPQSQPSLHTLVSNNPSEILQGRLNEIARERYAETPKEEINIPSDDPGEDPEGDSAALFFFDTKGADNPQQEVGTQPKAGTQLDVGTQPEVGTQPDVEVGTQPEAETGTQDLEGEKREREVESTGLAISDKTEGSVSSILGWLAKGGPSGEEDPKGSKKGQNEKKMELEEENATESKLSDNQPQVPSVRTTSSAGVTTRSRSRGSAMSRGSARSRPSDEGSSKRKKSLRRRKNAK